jgi:hypothetical protein
MHGLIRVALWGIGIGTVVLGVGGRMAMRGIALASGAPGSFSLGGTLTVVLLGAAAGLAGALILIALRVFLRDRWVLQTLFFYLALVLITLRGLHPVDSQRLLFFLPLVLVYGFLLRLLSRRRRMTPVTEPHHLQA